MYIHNISFIIPVKDDKRLDSGILKIRDFAENNFLKYEIIVCGEINQPVEKYNNLKLIDIFPARKGKCLKNGIACSSGDVIIVCDADIPVSFNDIKILLSLISDAEFVTGDRRGTKPIHNKFIRNVASNVFMFLVKKIFNINYDTQCGIKIFRSHAAKELFHNQIIEGLAYDVEIFIRATQMGYRIIHHDITWLSQPDSTINLFKSSIEMIVELFRLFFWKISSDCKSNATITARQADNGTSHHDRYNHP